MKATRLFSALLAALTLMASCDKIEADANGNYVVFSGATGAWYDSPLEIPAEQRAFVEKYTGVRCVNCPGADNVINAALDKYGDALVAVAVHSGRFGEPLNGEPDLRTEKGTEWYEYFGVTSQPAAMVSRSKSGSAWDLFTPTSGFDDRVDAIVGQEEAGVAIHVASHHVGGDNYRAEVHLAYLDATDSATITVLVIEDSIRTTQRSQGEELSDYPQNHVLRQVVTDTWGLDVDADGRPGTRRMVSLDFALRSDCNPKNCHLVAFISERQSRRIINVDECHLL